MRKVKLFASISLILAAVILTVCVHGLDAAAIEDLPGTGLKVNTDQLFFTSGDFGVKNTPTGSEAQLYSITGESSVQEARDTEYLSSLQKRAEVSFLNFEPGPFLKADDLFKNYYVAQDFVNLYSPYCSYALTMEEVKDYLSYIHPTAVELEERIKEMKKIRAELSSKSLDISIVRYNDQPPVEEAGKLDLVEVPKVIYHAYLNGKPYAAVVRFDAYSGENRNMKLYQGYMTFLKDEYDWCYYHCSGLEEVN